MNLFFGANMEIGVFEAGRGWLVTHTTEYLSKDTKIRRERLISPK